MLLFIVSQPPLNLTEELKEGMMTRETMWRFKKSKTTNNKHMLAFCGEELGGAEDEMAPRAPLPQSKPVRKFNPRWYHNEAGGKREGRHYALYSVPLPCQGSKHLR